MVFLQFTYRVGRRIGTSLWRLYVGSSADAEKVALPLDIRPGQVNPFKVIHIALKHDTYVIYSSASQKELSEMVLEILRSRNLRLDDAEARQTHLLHLACRSHWPLKLIQELLNRGSEVNSFESKCRTTLMCAVYESCLPMMRLLLEHGPDPTMTLHTKIGMHSFERNIATLPTCGLRSETKSTASMMRSKPRYMPTVTRSQDLCGGA